MTTVTVTCDACGKDITSGKKDCESYTLTLGVNYKPAARRVPSSLSVLPPFAAHARDYFQFCDPACLAAWLQKEGY